MVKYKYLKLIINLMKIIIVIYMKKQAGFVIRRRSFITKFENINEAYSFDDKPIGKGTYGIVRRASHKKTKQMRAVKSILKSQIQDIAKFKMEVDILRTLDHPNIVKLFEWYEDEKNFYLVMELCTGGELFEKIQNAGQFPEKDAKAIFKQVMSALSYCHGKKIVHRDLKPENFVFESKNQNATLKLIDFGLSKMYEDPQSGAIVKLKTKAGSPYYIAPEVLSGNYNHSCDIWSCGVILYILLCGYPPFFGDNDLEIIDNVKKGKFDFYEDELKKVSKAAKDLVCKMLTKPNVRPSAEQVLNDPWLLSLSDKTTENNLLTIAQNIANFRTTNKLQKAILTYMATQLNEIQLTKLKQTFLDIDKNKDGRLSFEEIYQAFNGQYSKEELKEIMDSMDIDHNNFIDYTEFLASAIDENIYLQEDNILNAFNKFDKDQSGKISVNDLKDALGIEMPDVDPKVYLEMIKEADLDGDNEVDFNEFMKLMYSYKKPKNKK